jgi:hypothetical protein
MPVFLGVICEHAPPPFRSICLPRFPRYTASFVAAVCVDQPSL